MSDPIQPRARRGRRVLVVLAVIVLLLLVIVAALPTLVTMGLGRGAIRGAIDANVNGDVQLAGLRAGWFGAQKIEGLRIVDASGKDAANLNVQVDNGLLSLMLGRAKPMQVTLSGSVAGQVREDGSISFADLIKSNASAAPHTPRPKAPRPAGAGIPPIVVNIAGLDVTLESLKHAQTLSLDDLRGKIAYADPQQPITLELHGKTMSNGTSGAIDITGQADGLFAQDGSITLRGASTKLDVTASGLPLPVMDKPLLAEWAAITLRSDDLTDRIVLTVDADARVDDAATPTHIKVDGSVGKVLTGDGALSFRAASTNLNATIDNLPLNARDVRGEMTNLTVTLVSDDLTKTLDIAAKGEGHINSAAGTAGAADRSTLTANLSIVEPFSPDGAFQFAVDRITGEVKGENVPTSLAQPALADSGVDAMRDLGPTVDLDAKFPGGVGGDLTLTAAAPKASAEVVARINPDQSVSGSKLILAAPRAEPALIAAVTGGRVQSEQPLGVRIDLTSFSVPAPEGVGEAKSRPLGKHAATGTITITGPANVKPAITAEEATASSSTTAPATPPALAVERIELTIDSPALNQFVAVSGTALLGGGEVLINQRITNLFAADGTLAAADARPEGSVSLKNLPAGTIVAFAPAAQADLLRELLGDGMNADINTSGSDAGLRAVVSARSESLTLNTTAVRGPDGSIAIDRTHAELTVTPALLTILQEGSPNPVVLGQPANLVADLEAFTLPAPPQGEQAQRTPLFATPLAGRITLRDAVIERKPALAEALSIPTFATAFTITDVGAERTVTLSDGTATLKRAAGNRDIAALSFDGAVVLDNTDTTTPAPPKPDLNLRIANLNTRQAEALLGQAPGAIANWTGDEGALDARVQSTTDGTVATLTPRMPSIEGTFTATLRDEMVSLTAETSRLLLGKDALQARLNPPPPTDAGTPDKTAPAAIAPKITVEADLPMQMAVRRCEFPLAMLAGDAFDPSRVQLDVGLTGGPLKIANPDGVKSRLSDLDLSLHASDLAKGIQFALNGNAEAIVPPSLAVEARAEPVRPRPADQAAAKPESEMTPEERREARRQERRDARAATQPTQPPESIPAPEAPVAAPAQPRPGVLDVTGVIADIVSSESTLALANARLQMTARLTGVPTAVADALANMQGLLVAAVGPQMDATFIADDFSKNSGTLDAKIDTTNGHLQALLRGRENSFRVNTNGPLVAELSITPALRDRLLYKIHPILADIRTTEQPLRVTIPSALAAIPADVSKLRADIEISVGKVELDSGSTTLKILTFFGQGDRSVIPGEIEPITAKIRNGIVTYDKFAVRIDKYTLNYSGQINLVKQTVDLRTEIPLQALKTDIKELRDYADHISVPLVTRGSFGSVKTSIDPDFDLGKAALDAGFKGTLSEFLKGGEGLFKDLFDKPKE